jgi:uncharacterized RDD family membrane protein YckC
MTPGIIPTVIVARPAGFWIRVVAALIDVALVFVVKAALGALAKRTWRGDVETLGIQGALGLCTMLFAVLYVVMLHALEGQTIGKLVVGVRVVGLDGAPPAVGASVLRLIAYFASLLPFGVGFFMAGLRADRRALHDLLAGTRVERLGHIAASASQPITHR